VVQSDVAGSPVIVDGDEYENIELNLGSDVPYSLWWAGTAFDLFVTGMPSGGRGNAVKHLAYENTGKIFPQI